MLIMPSSTMVRGSAASDNGLCRIETLCACSVSRTKGLEKVASINLFVFRYSKNFVYSVRELVNFLLQSRIYGYLPIACSDQLRLRCLHPLQVVCIRGTRNYLEDRS